MTESFSNYQFLYALHLFRNIIQVRLHYIQIYYAGNMGIPILTTTDRIGYPYYQHRAMLAIFHSMLLAQALSPSYRSQNVQQFAMHKSRITTVSPMSSANNNVQKTGHMIYQYSPLGFSAEDLTKFLLTIVSHNTFRCLLASNCI